MNFRWIGKQVFSDPEDPELYKAWSCIPELGGRVLCVVYNETTDPWRIVTAYFERSLPA